MVTWQEHILTKTDRGGVFMNNLQNYSGGYRLSFASDYMEGAHPRILERLRQTNLLKTSGCGLDSFSESARAKIRI